MAENTNRSYQIRGDEVGYDQDVWVASHEKLFGEQCEEWLADLTANSNASAIASEIVRHSRDDRP